MPDMLVPLIDMQARLAPIRDEIVAACARIVDSGSFVMGPESAALEEEFARYCGVEYGVSVANGTVALQLALLAHDIGPGDEVITVSHTFIATVEAITAVGATPVLVDIDAVTYGMNPALIEAAITPRTRAIIPVHLYGLPCDMDAINTVARRHSLAVIEDACQAHGATYNGLRTGALGEAACYSFYPSKNLGTIGEGGMIVTRDAQLARRMRSLRSHGERTRYVHDEPGHNMRLAEIPAAAARIQLRMLDEWNERRRLVAAWYRDSLAGLPIALPAEATGREHVYHLYVVQVDDRDAVRARLTDAGIGTGVHYPLPVHRQRAYASLGRDEGSLPVTERACERVLSLPMYAEMTRDQVHTVARSLALAIAATSGAPVA
jgi:dTDP-4-amino-4,6-dideoxygalactose transaminase